jgi:tRNA (mo5U34)-methyltransferase
VERLIRDAGSRAPNARPVSRARIARMRSAAELREEIIRLGPWHIDIAVTPEVTTEVSLEGDTDHAQAGKVSFIAPRDQWMNMMKGIYPDGLEGRSFMECACNCGAYCFWAKELGATECFGFDVREDWIKQARFLLNNRTWPSDGISFEVLDLYELPTKELDAFDIVMFKGIFYHLPDPVTGLKRAADLSRELLILDTEIRTDLPDGMLASAEEGVEEWMSGVYGLNWFPTGPRVLKRILRWLGFVETSVANLHSRSDGFGRVQMLASRREGLLAGLSSS